MRQIKTHWPGRLKSAAKIVIAAVAIILAIIALYGVLICHPGLFFSHIYSHGDVTLHSDEPIPAAAAGVLAIAESRLAHSPLFHHRIGKPIRIYVCNRSWRFALFANIRHKVGGLTYPPLSNNIFFRGVHFETNRLIGPSGNEVPGARTLSYYIAHEVTHTLIADYLGAIAHWRLPAWKSEGYADYIAKGSEFDYNHVAAQLRHGDRDLDPARSGLYLRYHLLVAFLLEQRGLSLQELFHQHFNPTRLEEEIVNGATGPEQE